MTYYNTNKEVGKELSKSREVTQTQEQMIYKFFLSTGASLSPSTVHLRVFKGKVPLTSVRRGMTDLTDAGLLIKTDFMVNGIYGKQVHTWKLSPQPNGN
jgi:hypothetical protein